MWKIKVWIEGEIVAFDTPGDTGDEALDAVYDQVKDYYAEHHKDLDFAEVMYVIEEMKRQ